MKALAFHAADDGQGLAKINLGVAGRKLTEIWTPDEAHEAMRDLVRTREAAVDGSLAQMPGNPIVPPAPRQGISGQAGMRHGKANRHEWGVARRACSG